MENLTTEQPEKLTLSGAVIGNHTRTLNGVKLANCPFNRAHRIPVERLMCHLKKCAKQHLGQQFPCVYNVTESVNAEDFETHLINCHSLPDPAPL